MGLPAERYFVLSVANRTPAGGGGYSAAPWYRLALSTLRDGPAP
jgi:hypothetical protein